MNAFGLDFYSVAISFWVLCVCFSPSSLNREHFFSHLVIRSILLYTVCECICVFQLAYSAVCLWHTCGCVPKYLVFIFIPSFVSSCLSVRFLFQIKKSRHENRENWSVSFAMQLGESVPCNAVCLCAFVSSFLLQYHILLLSHVACIFQNIRLPALICFLLPFCIVFP